MIALALSCRPKLLLADEPTTALDATVQIQILILLRELQRALGMATILVTHDLAVASEIADRVAVMYAGRFAETANIGELIRTPRHPYTVGLLASTVSELTRDGVLTPIPGTPPDLSDLPNGSPRTALHACHGPLHRRGAATSGIGASHQCAVILTTRPCGRALVRGEGACHDRECCRRQTAQGGRLSEIEFRCSGRENRARLCRCLRSSD